MATTPSAQQEAPFDAQYREVVYKPCEIPHRYGDKVHILADPLSLTMLARLSAKGTVQPEVNRLVTELQATLMREVIAAEFPRQPIAQPTRMIDVTPRGVWRGDAIATSTPAVVVAVARAGLLPSQATYDFLNQVLQPEGVRQDHLALARTVDDKGGVTGAGLYASKIGGPIDGAMLLIPDPMGATGSTISKVVEQYPAELYGRPAKVIALHLIITPEYLRHVTRTHPDVIVYALRLDRGLSPREVLGTVPGERWDEERGLTDNHYIVPGAGGLGEVINNSFV
jgi:uracil phosphoribosyltransferase